MIPLWLGRGSPAHLNVLRGVGPEDFRKETIEGV